MIHAEAIIAAVIFALGMSLGWGLTHKYYADTVTLKDAHIYQLETGIKTANDQVEIKINQAVADLAKAKQDAIESNNNLELSHASTIKAINTLTDKYATVRLHDPYATADNKVCRQGVPKASNPSVIKDANTGSRLSAEFNGFLQRQAALANMIKAQAVECWQYVNVKNCGIK